MQTASTRLNVRMCTSAQRSDNTPSGHTYHPVPTMINPAKPRHMTEDDERMVDEAFQRLLDSYLNSPHRKKVELITKAFRFAREAHRGVRRLSGEPYIMHPLAVAQIASKEMGLGSTSICAALLHDVVEDTDYTTDDIRNLFGEKIAIIVDGVTKISGGIFGAQASVQAENFKKLLLTMSEDIRVILIKICDRLHNMRTLQSQPANKQYKIAGETLYIYAPIADRLGLNKIKNELEDLSFRYEHPEEYQSIVNKLALTSEERDTLFRQFTAPISQVLDQKGIQYEMRMRVKSPYSIWKKMMKKHVTFEDIYDILAVRIIFIPHDVANEVNECFDIYVALNRIYRSHPDRLRDWLNHPKANGYQALHVTLMSNQGRWIEVQIRSEHMEEVAEGGVAAHWKYKEGSDDAIVAANDLDHWLTTIREVLDDPQPDGMDFLDTLKLNLYSSEIFVFTPKGEMKTLPKGSTCLDFAFTIHTFIGSHCIGAKVNHKLVPPSHRLANGDQVEIITSQSQHINPEWIGYASTAKAKSKIMAVLRRQNSEWQQQGENWLKQFFEQHQRQYTSSSLYRLTRHFNKVRPEQLLVDIGKGVIKPTQADLEALNRRRRQATTWRKFVPFLKSNDTARQDSEQAKEITVGEGFNRKKPVIITDDNVHGYILAPCCHPIPGDDILGYINNSRHIEIHNRACPIADKLKTTYGNRIVDAKWQVGKTLLFDTNIHIRGIDRIGMLKEITEVISGRMNINMHKIELTCEDGVFDGTIELRVSDKLTAEDILSRLKAIPDMQQVQHIH